ncbi:hypothetical protein [Paludibaculum fermentans]|uniref:Uncharacterized protein n=1 Tax=Paludibaculum fermentans TaxID=1473598 RepID=A0A7S7NYC5_PALFE|nr:hypothetical protein [Paludibaculum fermentans]QOY91469.1 hypothetical protein IRI77_16420 [Paludibaculum fermentans]
MRTIITALLMCSQLIAFQQQDHSYSVCEALRNISDLNGAIVTIKAEFSSEVGEWLVDNNCGPTINVSGYAFRNWIAIDWPDSKLVQMELKGKYVFPVDTESRNRLRRATAARRGDTNVTLTVEGLLMTRTPLSMLVNPRAPSNPRGFGHLGAAPARLVIKRILDVEVN